MIKERPYNRSADPYIDEMYHGDVGELPTEKDLVKKDPSLSLLGKLAIGWNNALIALAGGPEVVDNLRTMYQLGSTSDQSPEHKALIAKYGRLNEIKEKVEKKIGTGLRKRVARQIFYK